MSFRTFTFRFNHDSFCMYLVRDFKTYLYLSAGALQLYCLLCNRAHNMSIRIPFCLLARLLFLKRQRLLESETAFFRSMRCQFYEFTSYSALAGHKTLLSVHIADYCVKVHCASHNYAVEFSSVNPWYISLESAEFSL